MRNRYFARSEPGSADQPSSNAAARSLDCQPHVVGACLRDLGKRLLGGGADRRVPLARARLDPLATDEQPVALVDGDDVTGLRSVRVVPARLDG